MAKKSPTMRYVTLAGMYLSWMLLSSPSVAQDSSGVAAATYHSKVLFLPAIGASPETGFLFGAVVVPQFKWGEAGQETRSSSVFVSAIYTLKNQILTSVLPSIIFPNEKWVLNGNYYVNYFPTDYWGVGPYTHDDDKITALYTQINLEQSVLRKVGKGLFVGPYIRWSHLAKVSFKNEEGERIPAPVVPGAMGATAAGLGWISRVDRRNSTMTPTRNYYLEFSLLVNPSWLGSTEIYSAYQLDGRKYFDLSGDGNSILAMQALFRFVLGRPPFYDMSMMGGDMINRGYYEGRYRDQNAGQFQLEWRQHAIWRLGFTLFAGSGEVWDRFDKFKMSNYKWTAGAGLRLNLNPEDPTNLRIDFGFTKESTGFYIQFGEAF